MNQIADLDALAKQLIALDETRRALSSRLELTMRALALTLDAQVGTQERIDSMIAVVPISDPERRENLQRQREADLYRTVLALLAHDGEASVAAAGSWPGAGD